jgi:hypothetical protein
MAFPHSRLRGLGNDEIHIILLTYHEFFGTIYYVFG